jgi:hypothetical protein
MRYWVLSCLLISITTPSAFAQRDTVTLSMKNASMVTVIEAIKKQTDYRFSYDIELEALLKEKKITINAFREPIDQVLPVIFGPVNIAYKVVDDNILLSKKNSELEVVQSRQTLMQTVKGKVIDKESKVPLVGISILLMNSQPPLGAITDANGMFSFKVPVGKQSLKFTYVGYEEFTASDISVISGKETQLSIEMRESVIQMNEVVIRGDHDKDIPLNSMATVSARQITTEDASRYAAGYNDPARMVSAFAGVIAVDDGRNSIVIRGNSPMGLLWKLEGIEIPNPNHFNNGQGDGGGVFSIISSDVLANSDFFTGAFPGEYGNSTSGILDLNLRKGNADKREYGIQVGMIGSQISLEGPLGKSHKASYLFNYRYGNLQFLNNLGLLGLDQEQKPPVFQDLNFNIHFDTQKTGTFSLFGVGGMSNTGEFSQRHYDDEDHKMGVVGLKHTITLPNDKTFLSTIVSVANQHDRLKSGQLVNDALETDSSVYSYPAIRAATTINHKLNAKHALRAGLIYSHLFFNIYQKEFRPPFLDAEGNQQPGMNRVVVDQAGKTGFAQAFLEWKYRVTNTFEINSGVHNTLFLLNRNYTLEPRLALKWHASTKSSFSYGFGLHSRIEPISVYFSQAMAADGTTTSNKNLALTKAMHNVIGYDLSLREDLRIKVEAYYQYLYDVPVTANAGSTDSRINSQYGIPDSALVNNGNGYNKGIELTLEKFYADSYYFLVTGSLFDSKYRPADGKTYNSYFNSKFQANLLAGRDFKVGKSAQNIFSINFKTLTRGGFRYTPEKMATGPSGRVYLYSITSDTYVEQMPYYLRFDLGMKYRRNTPRYSWIISLDIQNLTNRQNVMSYESTITPNNEIIPNPDTGIGIIPVLNFKVEF